MFSTDNNVKRKYYCCPCQKHTGFVRAHKEYVTLTNTYTRVTLHFTHTHAFILTRRQAFEKEFDQIKKKKFIGEDDIEDLQVGSV